MSILWASTSSVELFHYFCLRPLKGSSNQPKKPHFSAQSAILYHSATSCANVRHPLFFQIKLIKRNWKYIKCVCCFRYIFWSWTLTKINRECVCDREIGDKICINTYVQWKLEISFFSRNPHIVLRPKKILFISSPNKFVNKMKAVSLIFIWVYTLRFDFFFNYL